MGAYGCPGASWARLLLLAVFLRAFSAVASSKFLAPTTEPPVEQAAQAVAEPVTRALSNGMITHKIGKYVSSLREVGQLRRVSVATRTCEPTAEQVARGIQIGKFKAWSDLDRVPDRVRHSPDVLELAIRLKLLRSHSEWEQLPAATRRLEDIVISAILAKILTDWTNTEDFPEDVRAIPGVVRVAIHHSVLTTRAQWNQLPPGVRQDKDVLQTLLARQPFPLDWDDRGVFTEEIHAVPGVVCVALRNRVLTTRAQWDQLPPGVRQATGVLQALLARRPFRLDWEDRGVFPEEAHAIPGVVRVALCASVLTTRAQWNQLPPGVRQDKDVLQTLLARRPFRSDWDDRGTFPEEIHAVPGVVCVAIRNSVLTTRAQWDQLPPGVRQDKDVLLTLLARRPFRLDWDDHGVFPEEVRVRREVVVAAIRCRLLRSRAQWDQLPPGVRQDKDVLQALLARRPFRLDWDDHGVFPEEVRVRREVVVEAIRYRLLRSPAQLEQLPEDLRRDFLIEVYRRSV